MTQFSLLPEPMSVDDQGLVFTKLLQGLLCAGVRFEGVQRVNRYPGALFWGVTQWVADF